MVALAKVTGATTGATTPTEASTTSSAKISTDMTGTMTTAASSMTLTMGDNRLVEVRREGRWDSAVLDTFSGCRWKGRVYCSGDVIEVSNDFG